MYLKRLELKGFKSFSNKTIIDFEKGITSIVGPNGSGKSNILDAIRWVLGEQSIKSLRGEKLEDVIFSGSETKNPANYCEVSLVIDNSDKEIDIEFSELNIKRKAYKSGESEFFLNNKICRLKDIKELFLDTGIGKDSYSIIEQGKVDEILSNNFQNRRKVFNEACKISKFRYKKVESEKNLKVTKENLERIEDIYLEIENQIMPLEIQKEKAEKYLELLMQLKKIEVNKYVFDIEVLENKIKSLENAKLMLDNELLKKENEINQISDFKKNLELDLEILKNDFQNKSQKINENSLNFSKAENEVKLIDEKINNLKIENQKINEENKIILIQKNQFESEKESLEKKLDNEDIEKLKNEKSKIINVINDYEKKLSNLNQEIENLKDELLDFVDKKQNYVSKLAGYEVNSKNIENRKNIICDEISKLNLTLSKNTKEKNIINENLVCLKNNLEKLIKAKNVNENDLNCIKNESKKISEKIINLNYSLKDKNSKLKIYKDMKNHYEGFNKGVKEVLKNKSLDGILGAIGQVISVDKTYEKAVETALGSYMQNVITKSEKDAKEAISYLKKNNLGKVTFFPIDVIKSNKINKDFVNSNISFEVLSDFVKCDEIYKNVIENILGRVILIKDIETAIKFANNTNHKYKIVTLDGEILNPGGSLTGGSFKNNNTSILSRNRLIIEIEKEIDEINSDKFDLENNLLNIQEKTTYLQKELDKINTQIIENEKNILNEENKISNLNYKLENFEDNISKLQQEINSLDNDYEFSVSETNKINSNIETLNKNYTTHKENIEKLNKNKNEIFDLYEKNKQKFSEINLELAKKEQLFENNKHQINKINEQLDYTKNKLHNLDKNLIKNNDELDNLEKTKISCAKNLEKLVLEKDFLILEIEKIKNNIISLENELNQKDKTINLLNRSYFELKEEVFKKNSTIEKYKETFTIYNNELFEKYEMNFLDAKKYKKENFEFDKKTLENLKRQIKDLGNINLDSIEKYNELKERYDFYKEQKLDLENSIKSIQKLIMDLEKNMKQEFKINFDKINEKFKVVYKKLFGGGEGELILVDAENILESDIEIISKPPGKKTKNLNLLSGGEKALTAISILFSIILTRKTPFCILDEIEAPLDDCNIYRFGEFLKDLSKNTQFISITHRRGTMECCDYIYGVTMEEKGVSKVLGIKLEEACEITDII